MAFPEIVTREEWLEARKQFLVREKQATRERDSLNAERRRLPMVRRAGCRWAACSVTAGS